MQSRYSGTGIQYRGGLMSAHKTISLPVLRILPEITPTILSSLLCRHHYLSVKWMLAAVIG